MSKPWPDCIAREAVLAFAPYSARGAASGALHLDANESPWAPPPVNETGGYNQYPAQQPPALMARLADLYHVPVDNILAGRGADEAIEILLRTFCEAGRDQILICTPTFGYYKTCADIQGAGVIEVPLTKTYDLDMPAINTAIQSAGQTLKIVFLCSPNNPTGNRIVHTDIEKLCQENPQTLIVVDEAYAEFANADSLSGQIARYPNLVVLRTLSKAYSLAGARLGVGIADPRIIRLMQRVLPPYPIPRPVEQAVLKALTPAAMAVHQARMEVWLSERTRVRSALQGSPYVAKVWPSDGNFLLLEIRNEAGLLKRLRTYQIKIRDFRAVIPHAFRLSIGAPEDNDLALLAFKAAKSTPCEHRVGEVFRTTKETDIAVRVNLDGGDIKIDTGIGFYDHMLGALAKHGGLGLSLSCAGDLEIDAHHTIEDCALALGTALKQALGDKNGIGRYGFVMPMDETQARIAVDLSGRPACVFQGAFPTDHAGEFPAEMCPHFFESLSQSLGCAIQIDVDGENTHHMIEACFKGLGRALAPAFAKTGDGVPSTKGVL